MEQFQNFGMKIMGEPMDFNALIDFRMKMMKSWGESDNNQPMNAANGLAIPNFAIFYGWYRQYRPSNMGWLIVVLLTLPDTMFLHLQSKGLGWEEPNV